MRFWGCIQGYIRKLDLPTLRSLPTKTFSASRLFLHVHDFARIFPVLKLPCIMLLVYSNHTVRTTAIIWGFYCQYQFLIFKWYASESVAQEKGKLRYRHCWSMVLACAEQGQDHWGKTCVSSGLHSLAPNGTEYENANPLFKYMSNGGLL